MKRFLFIICVFALFLGSISQAPADIVRPLPKCGPSIQISCNSGETTIKCTENECKQYENNQMYRLLKIEKCSYFGNFSYFNVKTFCKRNRPE